MRSPSPPAPPLVQFEHAAEQGSGVWVQATPEGLVVRASPAPGADAVPLLPLLAEALHDRHDADAAALALQELKADRRAGLLWLPAAELRHALACADSLGTLSMATGQFQTLEYSAVLLGRRFVALAREMGVDPQALSPEHRQAIDEAVRRAGGLLPVELQLRQLLARPPLQ